MSAQDVQEPIADDYIDPPADQKDFDHLVWETSRDENISPVAAALLVMEIFTEQARRTKPVACCSGCSRCCLQLVQVTPIEQEHIVGHLRKNRGLLTPLVRERFQQWKQYAARNADKLRHHFDKNPIEGVHGTVFHDWLLQPCIFLDEQGACTIYDVRPIDCRTMSSTTTCASFNHPDTVRYEYPWERWCNFFIQGLDLKRKRLKPIPLPEILRLMNLKP